MLVDCCAPCHQLMMLLGPVALITCEVASTHTALSLHQHVHCLKQYTMYSGWVYTWRASRHLKLCQMAHPGALQIVILPAGFQCYHYHLILNPFHTAQPSALCGPMFVITFSFEGFQHAG
jgi:hypothetical protein